MLNIFYGDMKEAVYNTASYFKYDYEDDWITDPFVKEMIQDVDQSIVLDSGVIDSPVPVSYTHLDVYKRQVLCNILEIMKNYSMKRIIKVVYL